MTIKVTIKQIVDCYRALDKTKANKLEESEKIKILNARKAMRPIYESFEAFLKDTQEMFKTEDWDEIQKKVQQWQQEGENTTLTASEKNLLNEALIKYEKSVSSAIKEEQAKEVELDIEKLKENSDIKLMSENDWDFGRLSLIEIIL